jgi:Rrf2 family protein
MIFSRACEYSIRAAIFIAMQSQKGNRVNLKEISGEIKSPEAFTAKILQQLVRHRIIESVKGIAGGFEMDPDRLSKITLGDVVKAIDGNSELKECLMGLTACSEKQPCPLHENFKSIRAELNGMLKKTTMQTLAGRMKKGNVCLKV